MSDLSGFHIQLVETKKDGRILINDYPCREWQDTYERCVWYGEKAEGRLLKEIQIYLVEEADESDGVLVFEWLGMD